MNYCYWIDAWRSVLAGCDGNRCLFLGREHRYPLVPDTFLATHLFFDPKSCLYRPQVILYVSIFLYLGLGATGSTSPKVLSAPFQALELYQSSGFSSEISATVSVLEAWLASMPSSFSGASTIPLTARNRSHRCDRESNIHGARCWYKLARCWSELLPQSGCFDSGEPANATRPRAWHAALIPRYLRVSPRLFNSFHPRRCF